METFGELTDEQFAAVAETLASYTKTLETPDTASIEETEDTGEAYHDDKKKKKNHPEDEDEDSDASEATEAAEQKADEEVLETVQAEETPALSVESDASISDEDPAGDTRASLQDWVKTVILNNNSESGE